AVTTSQRGVAIRRTVEIAVRDPGAGANAIAGRDVVSGDGRRDLSEHQPGGTVGSAPGGDLRRRSYLSHERDEYDRIPCAEERGSHGGGDPGGQEARLGIRRDRNGGRRTHSGVPRKESRRADDAGRRFARVRVDGELHFLNADAAAPAA